LRLPVSGGAKVSRILFLKRQNKSKKIDLMKFSQNLSKYLEIMTPGKTASYYMLINFSASH
jgi:hypothetical protein